MLAIRMQRTGRKGHAMFRVIVQESRLTPTSGKVVAQLGHYDPHGKAVKLDKEKAAFYLKHGAQPSERVARLFKAQDIELPAWVKLSADKARTVRNADKRRSTRPPEPVEETAEASEPAGETPAESPAAPTESPAPESATESTSDAETEAPAEESETDKPA